VTDPDCSVVVCTRHRPAALARCLAALRQDHPSYEVLVVDNSSGDPETVRVAREAGAHYVVEPVPGLSGARNAGARAARGSIVAFVDDDAVAEPDWLRHHAQALADPAVAASTGRILSSPADSPAARAYTAIHAEDLGDAPVRFDRTTDGWFARAHFGGVGGGANMALRRALFDGWGFREGLGVGGRGLPGSEEHYAFFELLRDGHAIAYEPAAVVHHPAPATTALVERRMRAILRTAAAYLVMLLIEQPDCRRGALRYLFEAMPGQRRGWRAAAAPVAPVAAQLRRGERLRSALTGPAVYVRCRRRNGGRLTPPRGRY
jgi:cellulose synthase/poly-beta-1,6-N-acetylglucosamine synthase-like glycosyltransferase